MPYHGDDDRSSIISPTSGSDDILVLIFITIIIIIIMVFGVFSLSLCLTHTHTHTRTHNGADEEVTIVIDFY